MKTNYRYTLCANIHELVNGVDNTSMSHLTDTVVAGNISSAFDKVARIMSDINGKSDVKYFIESIETDGCVSPCDICSDAKTDE